jgi:CheY-like chemotaxis protein
MQPRNPEKLVSPAYARTPPGPSEPGSATPTSASGREQSGGSDGRIILVIDDEAANLALARTLLESEGFVVHVARDAISAFDVLKVVDPALILMDIQLPGMDGWELTRRLRRNPATSHIPVIALTAYGTKGDDERAQEAGCVAFIAKPVSTRQLPGIVRAYLK